MSLAQALRAPSRGSGCRVTGSGFHSKASNGNHRRRKTRRGLFVSDRQAVNDHFAVGTGGVAFARVGLRVTAGFEVTAGGAHGVSIDVLAVVVAIHAPVFNHKPRGENV